MVALSAAAPSPSAFLAPPPLRRQRVTSPCLQSFPAAPIGRTFLLPSPARQVRASLSHSDIAVYSLLNSRSIVLTGGTGLIGRATVSALSSTSAQITVLAREPYRARRLFAASGGRVQILRYDAASGALSPRALAAVRAADAVLNLAGEPVEDGRWTPERKCVLRASRVTGTRALAAALRGSDARLVSASAVGFYGASADGQFSEDGARGDDFLARLAGEWEAAARGRRDAARTTVLRLGVVLARGGGAVPKMEAAFRAFLGGPPGSGRQWMSWVHIDDVVRVLLRAAVCDGVGGVYNVTAPAPVRLSEFCRELGRVLRRPSWLPVPALAVRTLLGSEAAQLILAGQRVLPTRALEEGFVFRYGNVGAALDDLFLRESAAEIGMRKTEADTPAAKR